ncbi:MAG TPA: APC family permease [Steroidobacteraceae bacterium]|nr:APC family permease [Steroidobacteraceae bacterium]
MIESASQRLESLGYKQELSRTMSLSDVVVYGLIYMVPLAPLQVFGFIYNLSAGMVAAVYVVAAVAMYFSAVSYCEMAKEFPVAGSVYSYVRFGTNEFVGFLSGWAILLDYLLLPGLLFIFAAAAMHLQIPAIPELAWVPVFVVLSTIINARGIVFTARVNLICLCIQLVVLAVFVVGVAVALYRGQVHLSLDPLYRRGVFSLPLIFSAIPIAALSYIGFDAISTLNEEAEGGGEMVSRATMIVLVAVAAMFVLQVYLAALFEPRGAHFDADTAVIEFFNVANVAVGPVFKTVMTLVSALIAILANAIVSQATTSRLIFSMARDGQIPRLLSAVDPRRKVPMRAIVLVAILSTVIGVVAISKSDLITSIVTFGSLAAYSLLHVAVMRHFTRRGRAKWFAHVLSPILGLATLLYVLWSTPKEAKYVAGIWFVIGLVSFAAGRARRPRQR